MINFQQIQYIKQNYYKELIKKLNTVIKWISENKDRNNPKIIDALYAFNWLLDELNPFTIRKQKSPTKKQRKAAIDIINNICENTINDKKILDIIKNTAEAVKAEIDIIFKE